MQVSGNDKKEKSGKLLMDLAKQRAKSIKARMKARDSGKPVKKIRETQKYASKRNQTRKDEMLELFQNDMSESKQRQGSTKSKSGLFKKKSKSSFKSKSRYTFLLLEIVSCKIFTQLFSVLLG